MMASRRERRGRRQDVNKENCESSFNIDDYDFFNVFTRKSILFEISWEDINKKIDINNRLFVVREREKNCERDNGAIHHR